MKKVTMTLAIALLAVVLCFSLAACSSTVVGNTYVFEKYEITGEIPEEMKPYYNEETFTEMFGTAQLKFDEEGKYSVSSDSGETWEEAEGTYKFENNEVKFYDAEDKVNDDMGTYKFSGGKLTMERELIEGVSMKITFKKK